MKEVVRRVKAPTPKFWKRVQRLGVVIGTIATVIATAPISLPAAVVTVGGYLAVASGAVAAVSQLAEE
jgi:Fe2+ transport system protein FeoA